MLCFIVQKILRCVNLFKKYMPVWGGGVNVVNIRHAYLQILSKGQSMSICCKYYIAIDFTVFSSYKHNNSLGD